eukprot:TRINITY_DN57605_c0_g1_i1.p1 TRINITY_DN57605_c0_g1~~TRINITY_DN57605_c0_g1_i1.p1  ORF type:complete len:173 (+),score=29.37 TRINITY_DN57605_c0_g1_i1:85-603(+)
MLRFRGALSSLKQKIPFNMHKNLFSRSRSKVAPSHGITADDPRQHCDSVLPSAVSGADVNESSESSDASILMRNFDDIDFMDLAHNVYLRVDELSDLHSDYTGESSDEDYLSTITPLSRDQHDVMTDDESFEDFETEASKSQERSHVVKGASGMCNPDATVFARAVGGGLEQ